MAIPNSVLVDDLKRRMAGMTLTPDEAAELSDTLAARTVDPAVELTRKIRDLVDEYHAAHGAVPDEAFASVTAALVARSANANPDRHRAIMRAYRGDTSIIRTRDTRDDGGGVRRNRPALPEPRTLEDVPEAAPDAVIVAREDIPLELADDIPPAAATKPRKVKDHPQA